MNLTISALAGRLAELHANVRIVESDALRFGDNPMFVSRLAALSRAVKQVEQQILDGSPEDSREAAIYMLVQARALGLSFDGSALPRDFRREDFCGGAYTERATHPQLSLSF